MMGKRGPKPGSPGALRIAAHHKAGRYDACHEASKARTAAALQLGICDECNNPVRVRTTDRQTLFCSNLCSNRWSGRLRLARQGATRNRRSWSNYLRTTDASPWLFQLTGGSCMVCGISTTLGSAKVRPQKGVGVPELARVANLDHDHNTGVVRGLLCGRCNTALGQMQDDPRLIRQLALYAETHAGLHASFAGAGPAWRPCATTDGRTRRWSKAM